jgi:hypothetical protein
MNSLWDTRIFLGLVPKESLCIKSNETIKYTFVFHIRSGLQEDLVSSIYLSTYIVSNGHVKNQYLISKFNNQMTEVNEENIVLFTVAGLKIISK